MRTLFRKPVWLVIVPLLLLGLLLGGIYVLTKRATRAASNRVVFQSGMNFLVVEALDDDLVHFEFSNQGKMPSPEKPIATTPMVFKTDYPGPRRFFNDGKGDLETADLTIQVDSSTLCVTLTDKTHNPPVRLTQACPNGSSLAKSLSLTLTPETMRYVYGLGEQLIPSTSKSLNWVGQKRMPGNDQGNAMTNFLGGYVGNAQFPVFYALGEGLENYAMFIDNLYAQQWTFTGKVWELHTGGNELRWYVMSGPDLPDLRQDYMELVGNPPVPPKKMFGLWVSEYGFDNWGELEDKLRTLRENNFPVDGFVMDLQWFGNITPIEESQMGALTWDTKNFPDPAGKIAELRDQQGIGLMTIEESYVVMKLPEFSDLNERGYLVQSCVGCGATLIQNGWWGTGGMLDWTNPAAADYWHDLMRQPLIDMGVIGHWTDLGEPEMYNLVSYYYGFPELDLHAQDDLQNLYNFRWSESIARGYTRNQVDRRPFMLSRSGTAGIARFGTSMWSGDIGSNLPSLAAHLNAQVHMSFSGMDYYGSDIGGFHRESAGEDLEEIYTKWFAASSLFDLPVRPHTENLCNCKETAPDRVGDMESNLANIRLRYSLNPYLYSLAYRAYFDGEPTVPPLVYYYQTDPNVRTIGDEKLLGRDLLVAAITQLNATSRDVYLPAGTWVDFVSHEWIDSQGMWLKDVPALRDGIYSLPIYARAGAIIPMMYIDDKTMNILGLRSDGTTRNELIVRVYPSDKASSFNLYEDDGESIAYQRGQFRTTLLSQERSQNILKVTIGRARGSYQGAVTRRDNLVQLVVRKNGVEWVKLNGKELPELKSRSEFDSATQGWYLAGEALVLVKSGEQDISNNKVFEFKLSD